MRRSTLSLALFLLAACGSEQINNPNFQRWCDDGPCRWEHEGEIARVSSWHTHDYALSFVSDDARLSQLNATASSRDGVRCLEFSMVADVDQGTLIFLELDFFDDGTIDFSQRLPPSDFELLQFLITPPVAYERVRFIIRKAGPGRAVLAELGARTSYDCTAPPVQTVGPDGSPCFPYRDGGVCE